MNADLPLVVSVSICLSAVLPLSSPNSSDEDSCVVKVRRWVRLLVPDGCWAQGASSFQYVNRSRAELQFDQLRTSTPTFESGETPEAEAA